jgi:hypothetical protein
MAVQSSKRSRARTSSRQFASVSVPPCQPVCARALLSKTRFGRKYRTEQEPLELIRKSIYTGSQASIKTRPLETIT